MRQILLFVSLLGCRSFSPSPLRFGTHVHTISGVRNGIVFSMTSTSAESLPTLDQALNDPFTKQLSHASDIIARMTSTDDDDTISPLLKAQLSHSDGIRGFMVSYLTGQDDDDGGARQLPPVLVDALSTADPKDLVPLACMNVIMPTGMITMHTDPKLSEQSMKTAERAKTILLLLKDGSSGDEVVKTCRAIHEVAVSEDAEGGDEVKYWIDFFEKWGYKDEEKRNIARAVTDFI